MDVNFSMALPFIIIIIHLAACALHSTLAYYFYLVRKSSPSKRHFMIMMICWGIMHFIYATDAFSGLYNQNFLAAFGQSSLATFIIITLGSIGSVYWISIFVNGLTFLPASKNLLARTLRPIATHVEAIKQVGLLLCTFTLVLDCIRFNNYRLESNESFLSLSGIFSLFLLTAFWVVPSLMIVSGLKTEENSWGSSKYFYKILSIFFIAIGVMIYSTLTFTQEIPVASLISIWTSSTTVALSLLVAWYSFRLELIDIIVIQCIRFVLFIAAIVGTSWIFQWSLTNNISTTERLLLFSVYVAVFIIVGKAIVTGLQNIWQPVQIKQDSIHQKLP